MVRPHSTWPQVTELLMSIVAWRCIEFENIKSMKYFMSGCRDGNIILEIWQREGNIYRNYKGEEIVHKCALSWNENLFSFFLQSESSDVKFNLDISEIFLPIRRKPYTPSPHFFFLFDFLAALCITAYSLFLKILLKCDIFLGLPIIYHFFSLLHLFFLLFFLHNFTHFNYFAHGT